MRRIIIASLLGLLGACATVPSAQTVPTVFDHDRIFVVADDPAAGTALKFYTDSGGGPDAIRRSVATRLGLAPIGTLPDDGRVGAAPRPLVAYPAALTRAGVPPPIVDAAFRGGLWVLPDDGFPLEGDGFLGSRWFRDRVWRIDYGRRTLELLRDSPPAASAHRIPLGFQTDDQGQRTTNFARLAITVDGEVLDLLLDTGATAKLGAAAAVRYGLATDTPVATSFITKSVFDRWVARHADWTVVADGESVTGRPAAMIEVPRITVAGLAVGPVWFSQRPDGAFRTFMASMMDRPVDGALGGSALRYFRVTIDYREAAAMFEPAGE